MIEPEVAWNDSAANMRLQEDLLTYLVQRVLERRRAELRKSERDISKLENVQVPFVRLDYGDAVALVQKKGSETKWGDDLGAEDEALIVADYDRPVFVMNYPKEAKAFYMKENPDDPRTVLCNALPGSEVPWRDHRRSTRARMTTTSRCTASPRRGLPLDAYGWYLDLRRYGTFTHAGFGLGLERTVAWICGLPHIREVIAFPRLMHRLRP